MLLTEADGLTIWKEIRDYVQICWVFLTNQPAARRRDPHLKLVLL